MSLLDCVTDPITGCVDCPALPAVTGAPARIDVTKLVGWNAGANSIDQIDGDLHAVFSFEKAPVGIAAGLKNSRTNQADPNAVQFGFYVYANGPTTLYKILERSATRYGPMPYTLGTDLEIRRVNGTVKYFVDGSLVYRSAALSSGPLVFNACLYATGDAF